MTRFLSRLGQANAGCRHLLAAMLVLSLALMSVLASAAVARSGYGYDAHSTSTTTLVSVASSAVGTMAPPAGGLGRNAASVRSSVAAEDEAPQVLRHYTTADRAEQILDDGQINPSADGKTYLTPDEYTDGPTAQSQLATWTEPEGYIEVPRPPYAPEPSLVEPYNGQPGGGLEVPVPGPVGVPAGSIFHPF